MRSSSAAVWVLLLLINELVAFAPRSLLWQSPLTRLRVARRGTGGELLVEPTTYVSDLYAALGVAQNASKEEIKEAYKTLMFQNHPDRNDSREALYIFRNASYAYQVVSGRDPKAKSDYDSRLLSRVYITALEDMGTDVLRPLAMDVAVPLINFTAQAVSSFLRPLFQTISETSSTLQQQQEGGSNGGSGVGGAARDTMGTIQMMGDIFETRSYEARLRTTIERAAAAAVRIQATDAELAELSAAEAATAKAVADLETLSTVMALRRTNLLEGETASKASLDRALADEAKLLEQAAKGAEYVSTTREERESVGRMLQQSTADVARLEQELSEARARTDTLQRQNASLHDSLADLLTSASRLETLSLESTSERKTREELFAAAEKERATLDVELGIIKADLRTRQAEQARQASSREGLERAGAQLRLKKDTLSGVVRRMESDRLASLEAKRSREEEQSRQREQQALEAMRRSMEARRVELEKLAKERDRLLQESEADDRRMQEMLLRSREEE